MTDSADPQRYQRVKKLAGDCLEMAASERNAFLTEACGGDAALQREVESLLGYEQSSLSEFMDAQESSATPEWIGNHKIIREVGRGGMGVVFEAEQEDPRRRVALKVLGGAWITREMTTRFLREAQALAKLAHPSIAMVHETGTFETEVGRRPYFTMEFVEGREPVGFCARNQLNLDERLELLAAVADAAHHAHENGIIHRDLKPDNILVRSDGLPKVLDFGIAQFTEANGDSNRLTEHGQLLGTLDYLSPEQVEGDSQKVGLGADIYALGVIGFELASGQRPFALDGCSLTEAMAIIKSELPAPPGKGRKALPRDVETILKKALEKEPERRYETARAMAEDIRRYLRHEPILARPASLIYRAQRFARRNLALVTSSLAILFILSAALVVTLDQAHSLKQSRDSERLAKEAAIANQRKAERARDAERAEREKADKRLRQADALTNFMTRMINRARPRDKGRDLKIIDALKFAEDSIQENFGEFPENELAIRRSLGNLFAGLGMQEDAERSFNLAREILDNGVNDDDAKSDILFHLAQLAMRRGQNDLAVSLASEAIPISKKTGSSPFRMAVLLDGLSTAYGRKGDSEKALSLSNEAIALIGDESSFNAAILISNNGRRLNSLGRYEEGEAQGRRALEMMARSGKSDSPQYGFLMHEIARSLTFQGKPKEALPMREKAHALARKHAGADHLNVASLGHPLAELYFEFGSFGKALELIRDSIRIYKKTLPDSHSAVIMGRLLECRCLASLKRFDEANAVADLIWKIEDGDQKAASDKMIAARAHIAREAGDSRLELDLRRRALAHYLKRKKDGTVRSAVLRRELAETLIRQEEREEAYGLLKIAHKDYRESKGPEHPDTLAVSRQLSQLGGDVD